jgi:hypothetical protein
LPVGRKFGRITQKVDKNCGVGKPPFYFRPTFAAKGPNFLEIVIFFC